MLIRTITALAAMFLLAACAENPSLEVLREIKPAGSAYQNALAQNYRDYAEQLTKESRFDFARYFADKGLHAAQGHEVLPEDPARWQFEGETLDALSTQHAALLRIISVSSSTQPELTASALLAYDQLVALTDQHAAAETIDETRAVLAELLVRLGDVQVASEAAPPPPPTIASEVNRTVLYFPFDHDRLGDSALGALSQLARELELRHTVTLAINGHADRAGSAEYNIHLSERRAMFVLRALAKAGIPEAKMAYFAFGEGDPAIPTDDGVREPKNRRVEITVE